MRTQHELKQRVQNFRLPTPVIVDEQPTIRLTSVSHWVGAVAVTLPSPSSPRLSDSLEYNRVEPSTMLVARMLIMPNSVHDMGGNVS